MSMVFERSHPTEPSRKFTISAVASHFKRTPSSLQNDFGSGRVKELSLGKYTYKPVGKAEDHPVHKARKSDEERIHDDETNEDKYQNCGACRGSGKHSGTKDGKCPKCGGEGRVPRRYDGTGEEVIFKAKAKLAPNEADRQKAEADKATKERWDKLEKDTKPVPKEGPADKWTHTPGGHKYRPEEFGNDPIKHAKAKLDPVYKETVAALAKHPGKSLTPGEVQMESKNPTSNANTKEALGVLARHGAVVRKAAPKDCPTCHGHGQIMAIIPGKEPQQQIKCPTCKGKPFPRPVQKAAPQKGPKGEASKPCPHCDGTGKRQTSKLRVGPAVDCETCGGTGKIGSSVKKRAGGYKEDDEAADMVGNCPSCNSENTGFGDGPHAECKDCGHKWTEDEPVKKGREYLPPGKDRDVAEEHKHDSGPDAPRKPGKARLFMNSKMVANHHYTQAEADQYNADEEAEARDKARKIKKCGSCKGMGRVRSGQKGCSECGGSGDEPIKEAAGDMSRPVPKEEAESEWTGRPAGAQAKPPAAPAPAGGKPQSSFGQGMKERLRYQALKPTQVGDFTETEMTDEARDSYRGGPRSPLQ